MSSEWDHTTLGAICADQGGSIQTGPFGSQLHTSDYKETGIPVVMPTNIGDGGIVENGIARIDQVDVARLAQHKLRLSDIVFSRRGDVTKNALVREHEVGWLCGTGCLKVRLGDESIADAKFVSYSLRLPETKDWLVRHAVGATMPNLNTGILAAVPLSLPPLGEQRQIAALLGALDDRITLLRETNATLEAIAQALFKSWFVDFDPVRAKIEGRTPEGMDEATAALFPDSFEETELGAVPRGWRIGTLSDISILNEESWVARKMPPAINYVDLSGVKSNVFDVPQSYELSDAPSRARRILRTGDCIVGTVRPGNRSFGFIAEPQGNLTGSTGFAVLSPKLEQMAAFVYLCATRDENIDRLAALADGGAYPAVKPELVSATACVLPADEMMNAFDSVARPLLDAVAANSAQAQILATLRDTLLPRLISGQLRLPEAQAELEAANAV